MRSSAGPIARLPENVKRKISLMCDVDTEAVVAAIDAPSIYEIPKVLHSEGLDAYVVRRLGLPFRDVDWTVWGDLLDRVHHPRHEVTIALVGKYVDLPDAYLSVTEALRAGAFATRSKVSIVWVPSDSCQTPAGAAAALGGVDGVVIPGGFGVRGIEGKIGAVRYARENQIPTLGLCLGLQCMVIESARHLAGVEDANSAEFDEATPDPVIATMADQIDIVAGNADLGGTMRLGAYPAKLKPGSLVAEAYGSTEVSERHRHRYEVNNAYREQLEAAGRRSRGRPRTVGWSSSSNSIGPAPVLRRDPGPSRTQVPSDSGAPAVPGLRRRGAELQRRATAAGRDHRRRLERSARRARDGLMSGSDPYQVVASERIFDGRVISLRTDDVVMSDGSTSRREVVEHPGAVAVVALDDDDNVVLVNQYRHPVGQRLDELPAGLLDMAGESLVNAAQRELFEEAGLVAEHWWQLLTLHTSPGMTNEKITIFLARGLSASTESFQAEHEELTMTVSRRPLAQAVADALSGEITNAAAVAGLLAASVARPSDLRAA